MTNGQSEAANRLEQRRALYPELYQDTNELEQDIKTYGVEVRWPATDPTEVDSPVAATDTTTTQPTPNPTVATTTRQTDIFGNIPGKEPAHLLECSVCSQKVNGLRFTSHLDKCMGIGTMSRSAAQHNTRK